MIKCILLAVVTLGSIQAQVSSQTAPASKQLLVNGRSVKAKILDIEGKHFIAVEDLAQSLGGTVGYSDEQITLTFSQSSLPNTPHPETGRIKGTVTYFFNSNYGNRPDTGSGIWLVEGKVHIPANEVFVDLGEQVIVGKTLHKIVKHTVADGNGNFDLSDAPPGQYTLVLQSNHTKALTDRDVFGNVRLLDVQVKAGETFDASTNFGTTAF